LKRGSFRYDSKGMQAVVAQGLYQGWPVDGFGNCGRVDDHGLIFEERACVVHALVKRCNERAGIGAMKHDSQCIECCALEVECGGAFCSRASWAVTRAFRRFGIALVGSRGGLAHHLTQVSRRVVLRLNTGRSTVESWLSATK